MRTSIELYEINTAFDNAFILCICLFHMNVLLLLKKAAVGPVLSRALPRSPLVGDMEFVGIHNNANQINWRRSFGFVPYFEVIFLSWCVASKWMKHTNCGSD